MRLGQTEQQENILYANVKERAWLFEVDVGSTGSVDYYWSTKAKTWNGHDYTFKIMDFTPFKMSMGDSLHNVLPSSSTTITVSMLDSVIDAYTASDFKGASVTIRLVMKADLGTGTLDTESDDIELDTDDFQEAEIMAWTFKVKSSYSYYQKMVWECTDWFSEYLEGDYNPGLISELFPSTIMQADTTCLPIVFGTAYIPIRWFQKWETATYVDADTFTVAGDLTSIFTAGLFCWGHCGVDGDKGLYVASSSYAAGVTTVNLTAASADLTANLTTVSNDFYCLGSNTPTYTISEFKSPKEVNYNTTYPSGTYTFKQDAVVASDSNSYKAVRLLALDVDKDGTNDANAMWGVHEQKIYDCPCKFSRSDLASMTNLANQIEYVLETLYGIPSAKIDDTAKAAAAAIYTARSFSTNPAIYYTTPKNKLLCKLLTIGNMILIPRDKIYMKVLTKTSQLAIEKNLVLKGTLSIRKKYIGNEKKDSAYFLWQKSTACIDTLIKSQVSAKAATTYPVNTEVSCDWIVDDTGVKQYKAAKLVIQRDILAETDVTFTGLMKMGVVEPGDVITINQDDHGAEGTPYDVVINEMSFDKNCTGIPIKCTGFSDALDDWPNLSDTTQTINEAVTQNAYTPVMQGTADALTPTGDKTNYINKTVVVGSAEGIKVINGADITLDGSETDPGIIKFVGTTYTVEMGGDANGDRFAIQPNNNGVNCYIGTESPWWETNTLFDNIYVHAADTIQITARDVSVGAGAPAAYITLDGANEVATLTSKHSAVGVLNSHLKWEGITGSNTAVLSFEPNGRGTLKMWTFQDDDIADDGTESLPDATAGMVFASCNGESGMWLVQSNGTVTKIVGSTNTAATDSDTDLCVYQSSTQAIVKNRLGTTGEIRVVYFYN